MGVVILLVIFYGIAIVGIAVMKKIQPEDKIYPIWVAFICAAFTCFFNMARILGASSLKSIVRLKERES